MDGVSQDIHIGKVKINMVRILLFKVSYINTYNESVSENGNILRAHLQYSLLALRVVVTIILSIVSLLSRWRLNDCKYLMYTKKLTDFFIKFCNYLESNNRINYSDACVLFHSAGVNLSLRKHSIIDSLIVDVRRTFPGEARH